MFSKFVLHDLHYGVFQQKARLIVTFLMFFCLSSYHFWTLRIFELTNPEYFMQPTTTADYFLSLIGGIGKVSFAPGEETGFVMPVMWMIFVLWMQFTSLYYPFVDLHGIGKQIMAISGKRSIWWLSKCVWAAVNTMVNYLLVFVASTLSGICFGAKFSMQANYYLARELEMRIEHLTTTTTWSIWPVFFLTGAALIAVILFQLTLSIALKPIFSYFILAAYMFAGTYIQSPWLFGNFMMGARSSVLATTGLDPGLGLLLSLWIAAISILAGFFLFNYKDVLGGD